MSAKPTTFERVASMNTAFGNPKGNYSNIDWVDVRNQCENIGHEFVELMQGLGLNIVAANYLRDAMLTALHNDEFTNAPQPLVRDGLCDIQVFGQGAQHKMGVNGDEDMDDVVDGVMTRFIKDEADKAATIAKHAAKGITDVYFEAGYPVMVMKSASSQPDAPKGKFLKSASYKDTVFRDPDRNVIYNMAHGGWPVGMLSMVSSPSVAEVHCAKTFDR